MFLDHLKVIRERKKIDQIVGKKFILLIYTSCVERTGKMKLNARGGKLRKYRQEAKHAELYSDLLHPCKRETLVTLVQNLSFCVRGTPSQRKAGTH